MKIVHYFANETEMLAFGTNFAEKLKSYLSDNQGGSLVFYLNGELGAGKTTFTRSIVRAFGYVGNVKSPTYTLVEEYILPPFSLYHFDLYRLADPEELEFMGIRDYFRPQTLCLLEWAVKGKGIIPPADMVIDIAYINEGRTLTLIPQNEVGQNLMANFGTNITA